MDRQDRANGSYFLLRTQMPPKTVVLTNRRAYKLTLYATGMWSLRKICQAPLLEAEESGVVFAMLCTAAIRNTKSNAINGNFDCFRQENR